MRFGTRFTVLFIISRCGFLKAFFFLKFLDVVSLKKHSEHIFFDNKKTTQDMRIDI